MAERTPGPWQATRNNWMGELVEHEFYIHGNEHKSRTGSYATGVAIVCGNATSHGVTDANARLIAAAPFAYEILDEISQALEQSNGRETSQVTRNELAPALARIRQYFKQVKGQQ